MLEKDLPGNYSFPSSNLDSATTMIGRKDQEPQSEHRSHGESKLKRVTGNARECFLRNLESRCYKGLDYLVLTLYEVLIASRPFLGCYLLSLVIERVFVSTISKYPAVLVVLNWFQIVSALIILLVALVSLASSTYSQIRLAIDLAKESSSVD